MVKAGYKKARAGTVGVPTGGRRPMLGLGGSILRGDFTRAAACEVFLKKLKRI
jgi:hypothetical protein